MPSSRNVSPNVEEYATLCFGIATQQLPLEQFLPNFQSNSEIEIVRLKWNIVHSAHFLASQCYALEIGRERMREEHVQKINRVFWDVPTRFRSFSIPCSLVDLSKNPGIVDKVLTHMHSLGRQVTKEQLLSHRQGAGAWFSLCVPVQLQEVKTAFDRFIAKKLAGEYKGWPGLSGFGDDWANFLMMAWRGGYNANDPMSHAEFVGLTRISPYLLGPIEGFAKKDFGPLDQDSADSGDQDGKAFGNLNPGSEMDRIEDSKSNQRWDHTHEMARRLIEIEKTVPHSVRMAPNFMLTRTVARQLKTMGFQKPFLRSKQQFIYDTILTYQNALEAILPTCLLSGPRDSNGRHLCWFGSGMFAGRLYPVQLGVFTGEVTSKIPLIVNIEPLIAKLDGLLESPPGV